MLRPLDEDAAMGTPSGGKRGRAPPSAGAAPAGGFKKWITTPVRKLSHGKIPDQARIDPRATPPGMKAVSEGVMTPAMMTPAAHAAPAMAAPRPLLAPDEDDALQEIEMPPSMDLQDHTFKSDGAPEPTADDVTAKLASQLTLKSQSDITDAGLDAAGQPPLAGEKDAHTREHMGNGRGEMEDDTAGKEDMEGGEKDSDKSKYLTKRQFVVQELYDTERDYVKDLSSIVNGYMKIMRDEGIPEDLEGRDKIVFGNIHQIYDWHNETMLSELETCLDSPGKVGSVFIRYERRLLMYVRYCENKPKSEYIVSEYLDSFFEEVCCHFFLK